MSTDSAETPKKPGLTADELTGKVREWFLATEESKRREAERYAAQVARDKAETLVSKLANDLIGALNGDSLTRRYRVFLPAAGDSPATIVEIVTDRARPSVLSETVDYVAEG